MFTVLQVVATAIVALPFAVLGAVTVASLIGGRR